MRLDETDYKPLFYTRNGSGQLRGSFKEWLKLMGASLDDARKGRERAKSSPEYQRLLDFGLLDVSSSKVSNGYASFRFQPNADLIARSGVRQAQNDPSKWVPGPFSDGTYFAVLPNGKLDCSIRGYQRYNMSSLEPVKDADPVEAVRKTFVQAFTQLLKNIQQRIGDKKVSKRSRSERAEAADRYVSNWGRDDLLTPINRLLKALKAAGVHPHQHLKLGETYADTKRSFYKYQQELVDHDFDDVEIQLKGTKTLLISSEKYGVDQAKLTLRPPFKW